MKINTSYFYKVRFLNPNQIPISTALSDPKWFHENLGNGHKFIDKNGVLNGIRAEFLKPGNTCHNLCHGKDSCNGTPTNCSFLKEYRNQIFSLDYEECMSKFSKLGKMLKNLIGFDGEPEIVLLVHEAPTNECSERKVLQDFFKCEEL